MPPLITPADRIFVAGHRGMAGSAICRALQHAGYNVCKAKIPYAIWFALREQFSNPDYAHSVNGLGGP